MSRSSSTDAANPLDPSADHTDAEPGLHLVERCLDDAVAQHQCLSANLLDPHAGLARTGDGGLGQRRVAQ